jgi:hypothetical protein
MQDGRMKQDSPVGVPIDSIRDITPAWIEARLQRAFELPEGSIDDARVLESFDSCSARNTRIEVGYSTGVRAEPPRHLLLRHWREGLRPNVSEIRFYNEIAPETPLAPTVPCYDIAFDKASGRWHVLLLDISRTHDQRPEPLTEAQRSFMMPYCKTDSQPPRPFSDSTYMSVARAFATLHGRWWNDTFLDEERYWGSGEGPHNVPRVGSEESIRQIAQRWAERRLPDYREEYPQDPIPQDWGTCERAAVFWPNLLIRRKAAGHLTLVQGDAHFANIFFSRNCHHIYLLDWDAWQRGIGPWDLACALVLSHDPEVRRQVECKTLRAYHDSLVSEGVIGYSYDQCLADYRLSIVACLFPPIAWKRPEFIKYALSAFEDWHCNELLC